MNRKLLAITAFVALAFVPAVRAQEKAPKDWRDHLRAEGTNGAMILWHKTIPDAAIDPFIELAGKEQAKVVLLVFTDDVDRANVKKLAETWKAKKVASVLIVAGDLASDKIVEALKSATGVWCVDSRTKHIFDPAVEKELLAVINRGGVVASNEKAWPGFFDIDLEDGTALVLRGREMKVIGAGSVTARLRKTTNLPERVIKITAQSPSDLTWLRRCAIARAGEPFPPKVAPTPEVPRGSLVIVGGGGLPPDVVKKFIDLAGGPDALIVVLPTAQPDPLRPDAEAGFLRKAGAKNVVVIPGRKLEEVEDPKNLELVKKAGGLWFGGGRQWRFVDAYENTKMHDAFREVLKRGGVIGGSSAGATIQGDYLCRGSPFNNTDIMCEGYERGLGFLPGVAIDQHFAQRKRFADMTKLMDTYPQFLGIGLDEGTAIVVKGHVADVMGKGEVHFYDRRRLVEKDKPDHESLKAGERYNLKDRKILPSEPRP
jgi:cyanophycinase